MTQPKSIKYNKWIKPSISIKGNPLMICAPKPKGVAEIKLAKSQIDKILTGLQKIKKRDKIYPFSKKEVKQANDFLMKYGINIGRSFSKRNLKAFMKALNNPPKGIKEPPLKICFDTNGHLKECSAVSVKIYIARCDKELSFFYNKSSYDIYMSKGYHH